MSYEKDCENQKIDLKFSSQEATSLMLSDCASCARIHHILEEQTYGIPEKSIYFSIKIILEAVPILSILRKK